MVIVTRHLLSPVLRSKPCVYTSRVHCMLCTNAPGSTYAGTKNSSTNPLAWIVAHRQWKWDLSVCVWFKITMYIPIALSLSWKPCHYYVFTFLFIPRHPLIYQLTQLEVPFIMWCHVTTWPGQECTKPSNTLQHFLKVKKKKTTEMFYQSTLLSCRIVCL